MSLLGKDTGSVVAVDMAARCVRYCGSVGVGNLSVSCQQIPELENDVVTSIFSFKSWTSNMLMTDLVALQTRVRRY